MEGAGVVGSPTGPSAPYETAITIKSITTTLIYGVAFVMALSQVGMDVAPILASAGVMSWK